LPTRWPGKTSSVPDAPRVFLAQAGTSAPTKAVQPVPKVEPTVLEAVDSDPKIPAVKPARPARRPVAKPKSNALLYGCLAGAAAFLLLVGLIVGGIIFLVNKAKNAIQDDFTFDPTINNPNNENTKVPGPFDVPQRENGPEKEIDPSAIDAEVKAAGAGVKLVKLDLKLAGLDMTIDAPEGAAVKRESDKVTVSRGETFILEIMVGRENIAEKKDGFHKPRFFVNSRDMIFLDLAFGAKSFCRFTMNVTRGHRDYVIENGTIVLGERIEDMKAVSHGKADCLLMIKCAKTLAQKTPPPADPVAALKQLEIDVAPNDNGKITRLSLISKATDSTLALLKHLPDLQTLDLSFTSIGDEGLAHLSDRVNLKHLNLSRTRITDAGLKHLRDLTNLESLDLSMNAPTVARIKGPGLAHLAGMLRLTDLRLDMSFGIDDASLAYLKDLRALKSLNLESTKVSDAGLIHLKGLTKLTKLNLQQTKVTAQGVQELKKALPKIEIVN
jgi:hypothetical protein